MAAFDYQAVDSRGRNKKGVIEGDSAKQVRGLLREQGLIPMDVSPCLTKKEEDNTSARFSRGKISASE